MAKIQKKNLKAKAKPTKTKVQNQSGKKKVDKQLTSPLIPTKRLLARSEGLQVDFKRDAESVKSDDLVAFANGGGGTILIGVDEVKGANGAQRGKIVGCDVSDRERNKIVSRANSCRPAIPVTVTIETNGKLAIMRVDIQKGGLHCTSSGTYKIHRDGQNDIIDPALMAEIIVKLERTKILGYLRAAVRPELEEAQDDMQALYEEAQAEIEDLRAELEEARNDMDYDHDY
jgi:predicted HTH transcriptional regulator